MSRYNKEFYAWNRTNLRSAELILPIVFETLGRCNSVIDLGCGAGHWISTCKSMGIEDVVGVDGEYVNRSMLMIPEENFVSHDLRKPFDIGRRFDLAISLEVAEHLESKYAKLFIDTLCKHSDIVLFSAAIPWVGVVHHVNEQMPSYWVKLFEQNGYVVSDCIRPKIWENEEIQMHYKQDILLFSKTSLPPSTHAPIDIIHPNILYTPGLRLMLNMQWHIIKRFPRVFVKTIAKHIKAYHNRA